MEESLPDGQMMQRTPSGWVVLGSPEHARELRLYDFLWDHAALLFGEPETFANAEYSRAEQDCAYCGERKHFRRRDAGLTKAIHKMGYFSTLRDAHPHLTLDYLETLLIAIEKEREASGAVR